MPQLYAAGQVSNIFLPPSSLNLNQCSLPFKSCPSASSLHDPVRFTAFPHSSGCGFEVVVGGVTVVVGGILVVVGGDKVVDGVFNEVDGGNLV